MKEIKRKKKEKCKENYGGEFFNQVSTFLKIINSRCDTSVKFYSPKNIERILITSSFFYVCI